MNDRELLELAAKAAGMCDWEWNEKWGSMARKRASGIFSVTSFWDPLNDDGDALRLAVQLSHAIYFGYCDVRVFIGDERGKCLAAEDCRRCEDKLPATRRAIVRAAAEIGKAMP